MTANLPPSLIDDRRVPEETLVGIYWSYDGSMQLGTPPRLYNQIIRQLAEVQGNNEGQNARLFAFVNAAMGDAGILTWEQKYCHDFWRPVVGIREHDETLGPLAPYPGSATNFDDGDPGWLPLGAQTTNSPGKKNYTPNFPSYPSGHAAFGAAALHIARMFYGIPANDKTGDTLLTDPVVSDEFNGLNRDNQGTVRPRHARSYEKGLWAMLLENAVSRIFLGVHWIFDAYDFTVDSNGELIPDLSNENIGGVPLGLRIARDIYATGLGKAPKMTPIGTANPPITTPAAGSPMPANPKQPASINGCIDSDSRLPDGIEVDDLEQGTVNEPFPKGVEDE